MEVLRQKLKEKVAEASVIQTELDNHERSIFVVKNQFSRQLTRLSKKEDNAKEIRSEWESENDLYKKNDKRMSDFCFIIFGNFLFIPFI